MPDIVQVLKQESTALGGDDADIGVHGAPKPINPLEDQLESAGLVVCDANNRDATTKVERNENDMTFKDVNNPTPVTLTELQSPPASGITEAQHAALDTALHALVEVRVEKASYDGNSRLSTLNTWDDNAETTQIRREEFTYSSGKLATHIIKIYNGAGSEVTALRQTGTITYSAGKYDKTSWVLGP